MDKRHKTTTKDRALHRIKIIKGHLDSVEKMIQQNQYCVDIVHQSRAVQKALQKLDLLIINNHLNHCVVKQIKNGQEAKSTAELLRLFEYR
ncbi:MAG: metal-sensing transcriptional repressor [Patescibacteria group bacterium]|jgi:DNA-binding FrmR family transcriptional regulator|nr:metal-sensing transcriptional repressor [Patescibacteria group bacterium]